MPDKNKFDFEKFKEYVNTYDPKKDGLDNENTIIKDILYGIGISLDEEKYRYADGFKVFKELLLYKFLEKEFTEAVEKSKEKIKTFNMKVKGFWNDLIK